jgi:hypothetical protein
LAILLATVGLVSLVNAWLSSRLIRQSVDDRMAHVASTLAEGTYPLETNVLRQVRGLSGADLVVRSQRPGGRVIASSDAVFESAGGAPTRASAETRTVQGDAYFYGTADLDRRAAGGD